MAFCSIVNFFLLHTLCRCCLERCVIPQLLGAQLFILGLQVCHPVHYVAQEIVSPFLHGRNNDGRE